MILKEVIRTSYYDVCANRIINGDVVDIGQTVNGCSEFIVFKLSEDTDVKVVYNCEMDEPRTYEYDIDELLSTDFVSLEGPVILGNIFTNPELFKAI